MWPIMRIQTKNQYVYQIKNAKGNKNECFGSRKNTEDDDESEDDD